jgi:hypothetical protein
MVNEIIHELVLIDDMRKKPNGILVISQVSIADKKIFIGEMAYTIINISTAINELAMRIFTTEVSKSPEAKILNAL